MSPAAPRDRIVVPLQDVWLALGVMLLMVVGSDVALPDDLWSQWPGMAGALVPDVLGLLLISAGSLPLVFRRIAPVSVFIVCVVASIAERVHDRPDPLPLGVLVALYSVAVFRRPAMAAVATLAYLGAVAIGSFSRWAPLSDDLFYTYLLAGIATVTLGYGVALGRARTRLAEQRASALAQEQEARTRAAVEQEQVRIAREIHDIVAHHLSVIVAQAAAAGHVLPTQPEAAGSALSSIEVAGRDALHGMRRLVWMLRTDPADRDGQPQPGLDRLPWLLAQVRQAGLPVSLSVRGTARPLSATVELNAYRIIQEALTNTLKHAGQARASVRLDYGADALDIEISDEEGDRGAEDLRSAGVRPVSAVLNTGEGATAGYGLISMKQRAALLGGDLVAKRVNGHGFRVAARLPLSGNRP